ncbi:Amyotrophic lateral sclerosis 2 chromosomal region candidate protein [Intoshia linei]|uniref:Amyotrophic lateral sclerosis 2 chromosomal region candidate protein n=1 Tax=Intoshia linei TaxID=1819745 RepID=A0A177AZI4_9BILA|nr:Amyotrophic lateral sclerosis 2 chromosomal region candidate protein [Intoshia linei]
MENLKNFEDSPVIKMKEVYWLTKQKIYRKLNKNQDDHVIACDSKLDAKLSLFKNIEKTTGDMISCMANYENRLYQMCKAEKDFGAFLRSRSKIDTTAVGKLLLHTGNTVMRSTQSRIQLHKPIDIIYKDMLTFESCAISDTKVTIDKMENCRNQYRSALMWMKQNVEHLDPDDSKSIKKYRLVQNYVRKGKKKFDKFNNDCIQKIDLLLTSRSNLISYVMASYYDELINSYEECLRFSKQLIPQLQGYQYYEFNVLKELEQCSKSLCSATTSSNSEDASLIDFDLAENELNIFELEEKPLSTDLSCLELDNDTLISLNKTNDEGQDEIKSCLQKMEQFSNSLDESVRKLDNNELPFENMNHTKNANNNSRFDDYLPSFFDELSMESKCETNKSAKPNIYDNSQNVLDILSAMDPLSDQFKEEKL